MWPLLIVAAALGGLWYYEAVIKASPPANPLVTNPQSAIDANQILAAWVPATQQNATYDPGQKPSYYIQMFQIWANSGGVSGSNLRTDGALDEATLATIQYWYQHQTQNQVAQGH
jgi:hypothetical protein